jgi:hypothetical protein
MEYGMNCVTVVQYRANHRSRGDEISGVTKNHHHHHHHHHVRKVGLGVLPVP